MARPATFGKKEREKNKRKKKQEKAEKKEWRKQHAVKGDLENMLAYVDEDGVIRDSPNTSVNAYTNAREDSSASSIHTGILQKFDDNKSYGFIKDDQKGISVFVHISAFVYNEVSVNDRVSFQIEEGARGISAKNVRLLQ